MEKKLKKSAQLHEQENIWWPHNQNSLCWSLYYINDGAKVDNKVCRLMKCHVCYHDQITITNSKTQLRKGIISYFKNNGITSF
jgi:hypothetical protein